MMKVMIIKNKGQCTTGPIYYWYYIYIVGSILLLSNFMQTIRKMCHAVQKIFLKKSILGPKFDLLTLEGLGKSFPEDKIYIV